MEQTHTPVIPTADFCMVMTGESMAGAGIHDGDIVCFAACDHPEDGAIVALRVEGEILLRLVVCAGTMLTDTPLQGKHSVTALDELPGAKIIGRVVETRHIYPPVCKAEQRSNRLSNNEKTPLKRG
jgi:SOS-response transcriptional repressor LexA